MVGLLVQFVWKELKFFVFVTLVKCPGSIVIDVTSPVITPIDGKDISSRKTELREMGRHRDYQVRRLKQESIVYQTFYMGHF